MYRMNEGGRGVATPTPKPRPKLVALIDPEPLVGIRIRTRLIMDGVIIPDWDDQPIDSIRDRYIARGIIRPRRSTRRKYVEV